MEILKEYIKSLGRWGWLVMVDIFSGITGAYLDISGTWGFPTGLWILLLGLAFVLVPFLAYRKLWLAKKDLNNKLQSILKTRPRLILKRIEQRKDISKVAVKDGNIIADYGTPQFTRIWIVNEPLLPEEGVDAEQLHGEIEYYKQTGQPPLFTMGGRWPEQGQPASSLLTQQLTLPPNRKEFCMDIGMKYTEDDEYYGYDDEAHQILDGRNSKTKLGTGIYFIKLILACKGVNQPFYFRLENQGKGHDVKFKELTEPSFYKQGSRN